MIRRTVNFLAEFSIPLISGVIVAIIFANSNYEAYHHLLEDPIVKGVKVFGYDLNFHFIFNDIFMVFFFGIATVEITQSVLPGGHLNPIRNALNPLMGTLGGVVGPIGVFLILGYVMDINAIMSAQGITEDVLKGFGIPTATDIALAWLVARAVFGNKHPAVSFLLLLAIADDAIGLGIIAVFYPDPQHPVEIQYMGLVLLGMVIAYILRQMKVMNMWVYLLSSGVLSWVGLMMAHLHPALALVFIIPFLPEKHNKRAKVGELFEDEPGLHSPLTQFEHAFKTFVTFGLFGFGLANAGVQFSGINQLTWMVFLSLLIGKSFGVFAFSAIASRNGLPLPKGMDYSTLFVTGTVAGLGLTVALFVAGAAYVDTTLQGAAKMGALFSAGIAILAILLGRLMRIQRIN